MMRALALVSVTIFAVALPAGEAAERGNAPDRPGADAEASDRRGGQSMDGLVEQLVLLRLAENAWVGGDFSVIANDGVVTLEGTVPGEAAR